MRPCASDVGFAVAAFPYAGVHDADGVEVAKDTVAADVVLLKAATYSTFLDGSIRLTTATPPRAWRTIDQPVASVGFASRSAPSRVSSSSIGFEVTSNDEPPPIGGEPTRS